MTSHFTIAFESAGSTGLLDSVIGWPWLEQRVVFFKSDHTRLKFIAERLIYSQTACPPS